MPRVACKSSPQLIRDAKAFAVHDYLALGDSYQFGRADFGWADIGRR